MAVIKSKERSLIRQDIYKWLKNALVFSGPASLVLCADLIELVPNNTAYGALAIAFYGMAVDLYKKWLNANKY
jgi:hypothetical protein